MDSRPVQAPLAPRSLRAVWHPCTQMKLHEGAPPLAIVSGDGAWLEAEDGTRYLDAISSWWVNLFGHGHPHIRAAIHSQLDRLEHVMLAGCTHEPVVKLSERLGALTGLGHAHYGSDGASATEIAMKLSAHYWRNCGQPDKHRFVAVSGGYHGETLGALAVTDIPLFRDTYAPLLRDCSLVPSPDWRQAAAGEDAQAFARRQALALEAHLAQHHASTAALIVEPLIQCAGGMAMHHAEYLRLARELCTLYGVHLICDEIAVGFGRTGSLFAHQQAGIRPDFLCLSKGLSGGFLPLAVTLTTDDVYQAFYHHEVRRGFLHSHSYTGNPLACAAANAVLDVFEASDVLAANAALAARIDDAAAPIAALRQVRDWRRTGVVWAFEVDASPGRREPVGPAIAAAALRHGV
ncbi:MAG: adenosylmethionine--8-amino-7-oxononanoate transaminase, partial [Betaproteobacteria bacterium]|nr:adenosylmethionine--8-amino-7-oxononanoate transaminase [Betaproteobacteria bacterium]